jgi:hypothetical protein
MSFPACANDTLQRIHMVYPNMDRQRVDAARLQAPMAHYDSLPEAMLSTLAHIGVPCPVLHRDTIATVIESTRAVSFGCSEAESML